MHMPVEAGHWGEPLQIAQCLRSVFGTPPPVRIHRKQRDVAEHHDRSIAGQLRNILADEVELIISQVAQLFQVQRVHQRATDALAVLPPGIPGVMLACEPKLIDGWVLGAVPELEQPATSSTPVAATTMAGSVDSKR